MMKVWRRMYQIAILIKAETLLIKISENNDLYNLLI